MSEMILQINHLSKAFGNHQVLRDIDFEVNKGDVISIIGASGSGKSTLLRCINLLETPTAAEPVPLYTIRAWEGQVAVFERHQAYPKQVYDMPLSGLPYELRQQLLEGVAVYSEDELSILLEDYTG